MQDDKYWFVNRRFLQRTLYFYNCNGLTYMVMKNHQKMVFDIPLIRIEKMLPENMFCRVHRCYLVNLNAISALRYFRTRLMAIVHDKSIPVSRRFGRDLLDNLDDF